MMNQDTNWLPPKIAKFKGFCSAFARGTDGNIGLLTALLILPVLGVTGYVVDQSMIANTRVRLEGAADAAALAAVKVAANALQVSSGTGAQIDFTSAKKAALAVFRGNSGGLAGASEPEVVVYRDGLNVTARVTWAANVKAIFGPLFGTQYYVAKGSTGANSVLPAFVKVYVMVDNSQSMGIGATPADQERLFNMRVAGKSSPNDCALACHLDGGYTYGSARAQSPPIDTRIDVVRDALMNVTARAKASATLLNQIKIGIYTISNDYETLVDMDTKNSSNFDYITNKLKDLALSTDGGGSDFHSALKFLERIVPLTGGDGASENSPLVFVLFMSDGVENSTYRSPAGKWGSDPDFDKGNWILQPTPLRSADKQSSVVTLFGATKVDAGYFGTINPETCDTLRKRANIRLLPLEIEYLIPIEKYQKHNGEIDIRFPWIKQKLVDTGLLSSRMKACATTPEDYFQASSASDINGAINAMFDRALAQQARLTK